MTGSSAEAWVLEKAPSCREHVRGHFTASEQGRFLQVLHTSRRGGPLNVCSAHISEDAGREGRVTSLPPFLGGFSPPAAVNKARLEAGTPVNLPERLSQWAQTSQRLGKGRVKLLLTRMGHGARGGFLPHLGMKMRTGPHLRTPWTFLCQYMENVNKMENFPGNLSRFKSERWSEARWARARRSGAAALCRPARSSLVLSS